MSISFSRIPQGIRVPLFYAEFNNSLANSAGAVQRTLLIGQSSTNQNPVLPVYISGVAQASALFGNDSMMTAMVQAYRNADPFGELWVLPINFNSMGTAATAGIVFTGPSTAAGTLSLYLAGSLIPIAVTSGMTAAQIATATVAAITAYVAGNTGMPFTAAVDGGNTAKVDITFAHIGTVGNGVNLQFNARGTANGEVFPAGVGATVTAFAGGTLDADLAGLNALIGDELFDFIGHPFGDSPSLVAEFTALMNDNAGRWSWDRMAFGHVWFTGAPQSVSSYVSGAASLNDQHQTHIGYETAMPTASYLVLATYLGAAATSLRADVNRPLQTLALPGLLAPAIGNRFLITDRQTLLSNGIATMSYASGAPAIERSVTTYTKNSAGIADNSYLDVETMFTLMAVVRRLQSVVTTKFARSKLAADGTKFGAGQAIVTPKSFAAELVAQYSEMETLGWVQDTADFANGLICQINASDPSRLDVLFDPYLVGGLRVLALLTQFRLQVPTGS